MHVLRVSENELEKFAQSCVLSWKSVCLPTDVSENEWRVGKEDEVEKQKKKKEKKIEDGVKGRGGGEEDKVLKELVDYCYVREVSTKMV